MGGGWLLEFLSSPLHLPLGVLRRRRRRHPFRHFTQSQHMVQRKMRMMWIVVLMPVLLLVVQLKVQGPR